MWAAEAAFSRSGSWREAEDEQEALRWAALQRLPTVARARRGFLRSPAAPANAAASSSSSAADDYDCAALRGGRRRRPLLGRPHRARRPPARRLRRRRAVLPPHSRTLRRGAHRFPQDRSEVRGPDGGRVRACREQGAANHPELHMQHDRGISEASEDLPRGESEVADP